MIDPPLLKTALHETHIRLGARMVPFGGWDMPVWYSSAREEHAAVRTAAGLFDVSHMGVLDVHGPDASAFLDRVGTNDVASLKVGRSHYSYLLDAAGDVIDDIMIYRVEEQRYLVVVNAKWVPVLYVIPFGLILFAIVMMQLNTRPRKRPKWLPRMSDLASLLPTLPRLARRQA